MQIDSILGLSVAGFHRMAYRIYGADNKGPLTICVHGLTRNSHDFDKLATYLAAHGRRVICPDIIGRGRSQWLTQTELYGYPQYVSDMAMLLAAYHDEPVDWVGTSMGGLIGLMLAAQPHTPMRKLVMNDIGPFIPKAALERLASYVGNDPQFDNLAELEAYLRKVHAPFGSLSDDDWQDMARHSARELEGGKLGLAYDPAIGNAFKQAPLTDVMLWPLWQMVRCPVLVLRGQESDLLLEETAMQMTQTGPKAQLVEFAGCGHAPSLMVPEQMQAVKDFLDS